MKPARLEVRLEGFGLHGGAPSSVTLSQGAGSTTLGCGDDRASLDALAIEGVDRATVARLPSGKTLRSVEHLLAAVNGCGAFDRLRIDVEGDELPLLDGAAGLYARAIDEILVTPSPSTRAVSVVRAATYAIDDATIAFEPSAAVDVEVEVDFDAARFGRVLRGRARWDGSKESFVETIAPARTFGAMRELAALRARGLAAHVPEGSVVALDADDASRAPRDEQEPIRHKLLDALGDLAALGAPLRGRVRLVRPSHRTTSIALGRARAEGVLSNLRGARN